MEVYFNSKSNSSTLIVLQYSLSCFSTSSIENELWEYIYCGKFSFKLLILQNLSWFLDSIKLEDAAKLTNVQACIKTESATIISEIYYLNSLWLEPFGAHNNLSSATAKCNKESLVLVAYSQKQVSASTLITSDI